MTPPKKRSMNYTTEDLIKAAIEVQNRTLNIRQASLKYNIPSSTLHDRLSGKYGFEKSKPGPKGALNDDQEQRLVDYLLWMTAIGYYLQRNTIPSIIKDILDQAEKDSGLSFTDQQRKFPNNEPSKTWVYRFIQRRPELAIKLPENLENCKKVSEEKLKLWYSDLEYFLFKEYGLSAEEFLTEKNAHRVFNVGDYGFPLSFGAKTHKPNSQETKEIVTALNCVSAKAEMLKPFLIFHGKPPKVIEIDEINTEKYIISSSADGCVSTECLFDWLKNYFYPEIKNKVEFPILLFINKQSTPINILIAEYCRDNNIILFCFPSYTHHILQPIYLSVWDPLKKIWNKELDKFHNEFNGIPMTKSHFFKVFEILWSKSKACCENIAFCFRKTGLLPFNHNAIDYTKPLNAKTILKEANVAPVRPQLAPSKEKPGIAKALKCIESELTEKELELFISRWDDGFDEEDRSDLGRIWRMYKNMRSLIEAQPSPDDGDVTLPERPETPKIKVDINSVNTFSSTNSYENPHTSTNTYSIPRPPEIYPPNVPDGFHIPSANEYHPSMHVEAYYHGLTADNYHLTHKPDSYHLPSKIENYQLSKPDGYHLTKNENYVLSQTKSDGYHLPIKPGYHAPSKTEPYHIPTRTGSYHIQTTLTHCEPVNNSSTFDYL